MLRTRWVSSLAVALSLGIAQGPAIGQNSGSPPQPGGGSGAAQNGQRGNSGTGGSGATQNNRAGNSASQQDSRETMEERTQRAYMEQMEANSLQTLFSNLGSSNAEYSKCIN